MKITDIANIIKGATEHNTKESTIKGVTEDSRKVKEGFAFVAISGTNEDGNKYVTDAINRGASVIVSESNFPTLSSPQIVVPNAREALAIICSAFYNHPEEKLVAVGITGTNGKTTTSYLLKSILEHAGNRVGLVGTIRHEIGERMIPAQMTTPSASEIYEYLAQMVSADLTHVVLETSSHALSQHRVKGLNFAVGIFTNITQDHLDYHKNMDDYFQAKSILFKDLSENSTAVLNADEDCFDKLKNLTKAKIIGYSIEKESDVYATDIDSNLNGSSFVLHYNNETAKINTSLVGIYNISNILSAAASAFALGVAFDNVVSGIQSVKGVPGRVEKVDCGQNFKVVVDYAHTPDALDSLLSNMRKVCSNRLICVFGCGGDRDTSKRPQMGKVVENLSDVAVVTSDNPRSEEPDDIIKMIIDGMSKKSIKKIVEADRYKAIELALAEANEDDLVVVAGKGHETYQKFKDQVRFFDDRLVIKEILEKMKKK